MGARDDTDLEEALAILNNRVEENNREVERSLRDIYGDLEDHEEQIIELAQFARNTRDRTEENFENINELWFEIDEIYDELDNIDSGDTTYFDFTGIENTVKYIGGGIINLFSRGKDTAGDFDPDRRKVLAGAGAVAFGLDYSNFFEQDKDCGDALYRTRETGWDWDFWGEWGEQTEPDETGRCPSTQQNDGGSPPSKDENGGSGTYDEQEPEPKEPSKGTPEVMYAERNGEIIIPDESFGEADQLIDEYGDHAVDDYNVETLEDLIDQYGEDDVIYVTENDELVVNDDGTLYSTTVEGLYDDAKDGNLGDN